MCIRDRDQATESDIAAVYFGISTNPSASTDEKRIIFEEAASRQDQFWGESNNVCLLYTSPSPRDRTRSRMPSSA